MNWIDLNITKEEYYQSLSLLTIKNDCDTVRELMLRYHDPILALGFMPYYALFCKEAEDYMDKCGVNIVVQNNSPYKIDQARLKLKQFNDRFGKATRYVDELDESQDYLFKNRIRVKFLRKFNLHNNIGIYYYNKSIIGNTQYYYSLFQDRKIITKEIIGKDVNEFAMAMGEIVGSISHLLERLPESTANIIEKEFDIYYQDLNTNKRQMFETESETPKSFQLFLLHTLSGINFARLVINSILHDNTWKLRSMYIAMYYANEQIRLILKKSNDSKLNTALTECVKKLNPLFSFDFRSCMMHYSFINKGKSIIDDQYADIALPMYGLVESCFNGMSYDELQYKVIDNLNIMANSIEELLMLNYVDSKRL